LKSLLDTSNEVMMSPESVTMRSVVSKPENTSCCKTKYGQLYVSKYDMRMQQVTRSGTHTTHMGTCTKQAVENDRMAGFRVHCWVLCLPNRICTDMLFFIEPSTGQIVDLLDENYHGIESIWNNSNYWINLQDCTNGLQNVDFDLNNHQRWESIFAECHNRSGHMESTGIDQEIPLVVMPSWCRDLNSADIDFHQQYPNREKTIAYRKVFVKKYAKLLKKTGCIVKLFEYEDDEMTRLRNTVLRFANRVDRLVQRNISNILDQVTDVYASDGHHKSAGLCAHHYDRMSSQIKNKRVMIFRPCLRMDKLMRREERPNQIDEYFVDNDEGLLHRRIKFAPVKVTNGQNEMRINYLTVFASGKNTSSTKPMTRNRNKIQEIVETFQRMMKTNNAESIREIVYNMEASTISIDYHQQPDLIATSSLKFVKPIKPKNNQSGFDKLYWDSNLYKAFEADPNRPARTRTQLESIFIKHMQREKNVIKEIRRTEMEKRKILKQLKIDAAANELESLDLLTCYFARLDMVPDTGLAIQNCLEPYVLADASSVRSDCQPDVETISRAKARCLQDCRRKFEKRLNLIQAKYDNEVNLFSDRSNWYTSNKYNLNEYQEKQILKQIKQHEFHVDVLARRIRRTCEQARVQYGNLEAQIADQIRYKV
jgi:hypothetical protein